MRADRILQKALKGATFEEALGVVYNCLEDANGHSENRELESEFGQANYGYFEGASEVTSSVGWNIDLILDLLADSLESEGFGHLADWCDEQASKY
jgi:hypothetical protein